MLSLFINLFILGVCMWSVDLSLNVSMLLQYDKSSGPISRYLHTFSLPLYINTNNNHENTR